MSSNYKYLKEQIRRDLVVTEGEIWVDSVNLIQKEVDEARGYYEHEALTHVCLKALGALTSYIDELYKDMSKVLDHEPSLGMVLAKIQKVERIRGKYADMHNMCDNICAAYELYSGDEE